MHKRTGEHSWDHTWVCPELGDDCEGAEKVAECADIEELLTFLVEHEDMECCSQWGEPGREQPERGIILCNWNRVSESLQSWLESEGWELDWNDCVVIDYDNDKAYQTEPDCYFWQPSFAVSEQGELLTPDNTLWDWMEGFSNSGQRFPDACQFDSEEMEQYGFFRFMPDPCLSIDSAFEEYCKANGLRQSDMWWWQDGERSVWYRVACNPWDIETE